MNINDIKIEQFPTRKYFKGIANDIDDVREFIQYCNIAQSKLNLDNKIKFFKTHNAFGEQENILSLMIKILWVSYIL